MAPLREGRGKAFILVAQCNLPKTIVSKLHQSWDDGISSLVALSGESLSIYGEPLARFKVSQLGKSALVVPVKLKKEVVGLLVVVRKVAQPFSPSNRNLLEAAADYASISLVNASLFRALEERAHTLQQVAESAQNSEWKKDQIIKNFQNQTLQPLGYAIKTIDALLIGDEMKFSTAQKEELINTLEYL